jgi:hypothetical protein
VVFGVELIRFARRPKRERDEVDDVDDVYCQTPPPQLVFGCFMSTQKRKETASKPRLQCNTSLEADPCVGGRTCWGHLCKVGLVCGRDDGRGGGGDDVQFDMGR